MDTLIVQQWLPSNISRLLHRRCHTKLGCRPPPVARIAKKNLEEGSESGCSRSRRKDAPRESENIAMVDENAKEYAR